MLDYVKWNPDNTVCIRGRVIKDDFSKNYKVNDQGYTTMTVMIAVFNPYKASNSDKYKYARELVPVQFFGHVKDDKFPKGGLLERFLKFASKKTNICIYGHLQNYFFKMADGFTRSTLQVHADTFRTDGDPHAKEKFFPEYGEEGLPGLNSKYHAGEDE